MAGKRNRKIEGKGNFVVVFRETVAFLNMDSTQWRRRNGKRYPEKSRSKGYKPSSTDTSGKEKVFIPLSADK